MNPPGFFLHVGYAKAGSTLIAGWFLKNPSFKRCYVSIDKQVNSLKFEGNIQENNNRQCQYYVINNMNFATPRFVNDNYAKIKDLKKEQKNICNLLAIRFPAAKVLIVTRGYVSMFSANYSQYVKEGGAMKFSDIRQFGNQVKDLFDYTYFISLYRESFGKENILVLPYELMKENNSVFFRKIEEYLCLPHFDFKADIVNPSWKTGQLENRRKINSFFVFLAKYGGNAGKLIKNWHVKKLRNKPVERISRSDPEMQTGTKNPLVQVPEDILASLRKNSSLLKEYPVFEKYMPFY